MPSKTEQKKPEPKSPVQNFGPYATGSGLIEVAIWENQIVVDGDREVAVHSVTITRSYKQGDEWKKSSSFRQADLPVVQYALGKTYAWLMDHHKNTE